MTWRPTMLLPIIGVIYGVLVLVAATFAHDEGHPLPAKVADEDAHRPSPIPDRILLTWTADPSLSQTVSWRTDATVQSALAEFAVSGDGPRFAEHAVRVTAATTVLETDLGTAKFHEARLRNLRPSTLYAYRVGDGVNWSEWSHFRTGSQRAEPFSFIYFGDAQNDLKSHWSRVAREAFRDAPRAAFLLHAGDLVNRANSDSDWGEWYYASGFINRVTPSIATPGNHEYFKTGELDEDGEDIRQLSLHWRPTLALPANGPVGLEETVYWIDYQGVRIVSLNSNERQREQVPWLASVLSNNPNRWTIITFHHPMYSTKIGRDNPELRRLWQPLFDRYQVDLVLQGHDHTYGRTKLMSASDNVADGKREHRTESGTVYVVSVSGPKMYELGRQPFMRRAGEEIQLYQIISIDHDLLTYEARTATGQLYDAFKLEKRSGRPNRLIDQVPDTIERRRVP